MVAHSDQLLTTFDEQGSQFLHWCQTLIWEAKINFSRGKNRHGGSSVPQPSRGWQAAASWLDVTSLHCYTQDIMSPRQHIEPGGAPIRGLVPWCTLTSMQKTFSHLSLFLSPLFFLLFKDAAASYDFNDNDPDPFPRYDATNENKWVICTGAALSPCLCLFNQHIFTAEWIPV